MKTAITTILFLLVICTASANTDVIQQCQRNNISLYGYYDDSKLNDTQTRNLPILPIQVFLDDTDLCFEFSSAIFDLNIILTINDMEVENKTISVEKGQREIIDLSDCDTGIYKIMLITPKGIYLSGHFEYIN